SPPEVIGVLNLRGRIVTVLDLHARVVGGAPPPLPLMRLERGLVVAHNGAPYAIRVDAIGDLQNFDNTVITAAPAAITPVLDEVSAGVHMGASGLTVILDVDKTLGSLMPSPALAAPLRQVTRR
ncbi:MAG: chemotaxis protein CheW, partial [Thalassobaculaceae bacterium]